LPQHPYNNQIPIHNSEEIKKLSELLDKFRWHPQFHHMLAQSLLEMKPTAVVELNIRNAGLDRVDNEIPKIMYHALNGHFL
jgi:hypothetical protein